MLTTCYNREKYLAESIESTLNSTFKDFELIVVDDHSSDRSLEIAREYEKKDSRVRVYVNEKQLGDYPNRNKAASYARGKYIKYLDSDDIIYPWGLEAMVNCMEKFPKAAYGTSPQVPEMRRPLPFEISPKEAYEGHYSGKGYFDAAPLNTIIRKSAFDQVGGFSGKRFVGDFELWHKLSAQFYFVLIPEGLAWFRSHADQEFVYNRKLSLVWFQYYLVSMQILSSSNHPLPEADAKKIVVNQSKLAARYILRSFQVGKIKDANEMMKQVNWNFQEVVKKALLKSG